MNQETIDRMIAVVAAARALLRTTPKGGAAGTKHIYQIEASKIWALDSALRELDANHAPQIERHPYYGRTKSGADV